MKAKITDAFLITGVILLILLAFLRKGKGEKPAKVSLPNLPNYSLFTQITNTIRLYIYNKPTPRVRVAFMLKVIVKT